MIVPSNKNTYTKKVAVYPGSFHPVHPGHLSIIKQAALLFDEVWVLVSDNPDKTYKMTLDQRVKSIKDLLDVGCTWCRKIHVDYMKEPTLVEYCRNSNTRFVVRGIRNGTDLDYERMQIEYNKILGDDISDLNYVYFSADKNTEHLSSTGVKAFIKYATVGQLISLYEEAGWIWASDKYEPLNEIWRAFHGN